MYRRPLHPNAARTAHPHRHITACPTRESSSVHGCSSGNGPSLAQTECSREIFSTIFSNPRRKKDMSQDGFVVKVVGVRVALYDERGKQITHRIWRQDDNALSVGTRTLLGGLECELLEVVNPKSFDSITSDDAPAVGHTASEISGHEKLKSGTALPRARHALQVSDGLSTEQIIHSDQPVTLPALNARRNQPQQQPGAESRRAFEASVRGLTLRRGVPRGPEPLVDPSCAPPGALLLNAGELNAVPVFVDAFLARQMRQHQKEGVQFMYDCIMGRRTSNLGQPTNGCILAHCMGLGKSLQALALVHTILKQGPSGAPLIRKAVIACPASLVNTWAAECHKWLGPARLKPTLLPHGRSVAQVAAREFTVCRPQTLLIAGYETLRAHAQELTQADIGLVVCDEGHRLKNAAGSQTSDALRNIGKECPGIGGACKRVVLTGTPIQNDLEELWAMCDFAAPGMLPPLAEFRSMYVSPINIARRPDASEFELELAGQSRQQLKIATEPFMQWRDRSVLDSLLPARHELVLCCRLTPFQRLRYTQVLSGLQSDGNDGVEHLAAIMRLRAICSNGGDPQSECDVPGLDAAIEDTGKLAVLTHLLPQMAEHGDRMVIVCQFQRSMDLLEDRLSAIGLGSVRVDGRVSAEKRQQLVDRFNSPHSRESVFLLATRAGGTGFNLTSANRLILFDPDWNPAADQQAMARVFRDGQKRDVIIWRLLSAGTIEEKMLQRQLVKSELARSVSAHQSKIVQDDVGGESRASDSKFSPQELKAIFSYDPQARCETLELLLRSAGQAAEVITRMTGTEWLDSLTDGDLRDAVLSTPKLSDLLTYACDAKQLQASSIDSEGARSCASQMAGAHPASTSLEAEKGSPISSSMDLEKAHLCASTKTRADHTCIPPGAQKVLPASRHSMPDLSSMSRTSPNDRELRRFKSVEEGNNAHCFHVDVSKAKKMVEDDLLEKRRESWDGAQKKSSMVQPIKRRRRVIIIDSGEQDAEC